MVPITAWWLLGGCYWFLDCYGLAEGFLPIATSAWNQDLGCQASSICGMKLLLAINDTATCRDRQEKIKVAGTPLQYTLPLRCVPHPLIVDGTAVQHDRGSTELLHYPT
jgi:hypothetical protein